MSKYLSSVHKADELTASQASEVSYYRGKVVEAVRYN